MEHESPGEGDGSEEPSARPGWIELVGGPSMLVLFGVAMVLGAGLGWWLLGDSWSVTRRILGGAFMGLCASLVVWANRALGGWS